MNHISTFRLPALCVLINYSQGLCMFTWSGMGWDGERDIQFHATMTTVETYLNVRMYAIQLEVIN